MEGEKAGPPADTITAYPPAEQIPQAYPPDNYTYPPASQNAYPPADPASDPPPYSSPPDSTAYPPAGGAVYPPVGNHYPAAGGAYYNQQPAMMQQQQSNVVVVNSQPSKPVVTTFHTQQSHVGQGALIFAAFVTIFAVCFCWWALFCAIPAIIFASNANSALDAQTARNKRNISLALSGVTLFVGLAGVAIFFGIIFGYYVPFINNARDRGATIYYNG